MSPTPEEWMQENADRIATRQRSAADSAKIAATFVAGVAAALVGTGLQVAPVNRLDRYSVLLLDATVGLTLLVFFLDRTSEVNHDEVLADAKTQHWNDNQIIEELRLRLLWACRDNELVLREIKFAMVLEFVVAIAAGSVAVIGLLGLA